jgi:hypothetical protein
MSTPRLKSPPPEQIGLRSDRGKRTQLKPSVTRADGAFAEQRCGRLLLGAPRDHSVAVTIGRFAVE